MSDMIDTNGAVPGDSIQQEQLKYKNIWCRLENGGYCFLRSYPAHSAERYAREYNEVVSTERSYHAFPMGFDANVLGPEHFSLVVVQAIEDHLLYPNDPAYRRIKEQVIDLAISCHGMAQAQVETIEREFTSAFQLSEGPSVVLSQVERDINLALQRIVERESRLSQAYSVFPREKETGNPMSEEIKRQVVQEANELLMDYCDGTYIGLGEESKPSFDLRENSVLVDDINPFELRDRIVQLVMKYVKDGQ